MRITSPPKWASCTAPYGPAQARSGTAERPGCCGEPVRSGGGGERAGHGMSNLGEKAPRCEVRGVQQVAHGRDWREGNTARLRLVIEVVHALFLHPRFQEEL